MADPLSLISSCISIVQGIEIIYKFAKSNIHSATTVRSKLSALIARCSACKGIIEGIKFQAELDADGENSRLVLLQHVDEPIHALNGAIQTMTMKLEKISGRSAVFGTIIGSSVDSCLKTFDDTLRILNLALQADQISMMTSIREYSREVKSDLFALHTALENLNDNVSRLIEVGVTEYTFQKKQREHNAQQEISSWLSTLDQAQLYRSLAEKTHPGTGEWFLEPVFNQWLSVSGLEQQHRVLWLRGRSGAGKTTLVTSTISHLNRQSKRPALAYFFCSVSLSDTRSLSTLLGSIIVQLCNEKPEIWQDIKALRDNQMQRQNGVLRNLQVEELGKVLGQVCSSFDDVLLILDAPNESESPKKMLTVIGDLIGQTANLRVFISSTLDLDPTSLRHHNIQYVHMSSSEVNADIGKCIRAKMDNEEQLQDFPQYLKDRILARILVRADGLFRWAECQLSAIVENATSEAAVNDALGNLSSTLEELYTETLAAVPPSQTRLLKQALLWLAFAIRPLHVSELREIMILRDNLDEIRQEERLLPGKAEIILSKCRMLVNFDASSGLASLAHSSVRDFLFSEQCRSGQAAYFHIEGDIAACQLTCLCLRYLNMPAFAEGFIVPQQDIAARLEQWSLLSYTSQAWLALSLYMDWDNQTQRDQIRESLQTFFDSATKPRGGNFGSWVQVYIPRHLRANVRAHDDQSLSTPLYYAARSGLLQVTQMILEIYGKHALEVPGGSRHSTPLHAAAAYGWTPMVRYLLQEGANPNERNGHGQRGVAWAELYGYDDIVELYMEYGAKPLTDQDRKGLPLRKNVRRN